MPNTDNNSKDLSQRSVALDEMVFRNLSERGEIIPETVEEVARAEERLAKNPPVLPSRLKDPKKILDRIKARKQDDSERVSKVAQFPEMPSTKIEEELAWAARNGTEMTPAVQEKLRQNREKALEQINKQKLG